MAQSVTFDLHNLMHLGALNDAFEEVLWRLEESDGTSDAFDVLTDEYGWIPSTAELPTGVRSIHKLWMASSQKYWRVAITDASGKVSIELRYAGGID